MLRKALLIFGVMVAALGASAWTASSQKTTLPGSTVKITYSNDHGSAVHIGNGYFVTAAHVVVGRGLANYQDDKGGVGIMDVLWANEKYDVALMHDPEADEGVSNLSCVTPSIGSELKLTGNPQWLDFQTTRGHVSGAKLGEDSLAPGRVTVDVTILPGMSGGGAFDERGNLVGINSAIMLFPVVGSMGQLGSNTGIGFIIPASLVCHLMGK